MGLQAGGPGMVQLSSGALPDAVAYGLFQYVNIYIFQRFESYAVTRNLSLTYAGSKMLRQVLFVRQAHNVYGNTFAVAAETDLVKRLRRAVFIAYAKLPVADIGVADHLAALVFAIQEPQPGIGQQLQHQLMQGQQVGAFGFLLAGEVSVDLFLCVHGREVRDLFLLGRV